MSLVPEDVVDLNRYPIDEFDSADRAALVARLRADLAKNQHCSLPNFITQEALDRAVADAQGLRSSAFDNNATRNCYLQRQGNPDLSADHPRNLLFDTSTRMIACDLIPDDSPLKTLYYWDATRKLIADIVDTPMLYPNEDPYQPVNILCYREGDRSAWHFDSDSSFTMTLMLQAAELGGEFEMVPNTRSDDDQNEAYVGQVLLGNRPGDAVQVAREVGSLCIFRGCNSLHRVSEVVGPRMRIMGVFVYEYQPGIKGDPEVNETIYGSRVIAR
ncbi:MAG: hypothetical protein ACC642_11335 [Pseudomonadales bacterium]